MIYIAGLEDRMPHSSPSERRLFALCFSAVQLLAICITGVPAHSEASACDKAAVSASLRTGVPQAVLQAVTRVETGRFRGGIIEPWPWAVNVNGKSYWFDSHGSAASFATRQLRSGVRNFDVGCFQLNYRWHGEAFLSIEEMFDPESNAQYAGEFLSELYQEFKDWEVSAGAYHSRTKKFADRYRSRFREIHASLKVVSGPLPQFKLKRRAVGAGSVIFAEPGGSRPPGSLVSISGPREALIDLN